MYQKVWLEALNSRPALGLVSLVNFQFEQHDFAANADRIRE